MDARESRGRTCVQDRLEGRVDGRRARRRHDRINEIHRIVRQDARGAAQRVAHDRAAGRRLGRSRDVRGSQRGAVDPDGVPGDVVGARGSTNDIEVVPRRPLPAFPTRLIKTEALHPALKWVGVAPTFEH